MNINISIEARMTSSRLPGKVLKKINDIPTLELMIKRIKNTKKVNQIIVATTINKSDDSIVEWCEENNISYFRGSEENVYERVLSAHKHYKTDIVIELTGDCPLLSCDIIEECLDFYLLNEYDYVSNCLEMSYPIGTAVQVYSLNTLESISNNRELDYQDKEHVTPYLYLSNKYKTYNIKASKKHYMPELSITLDTIEDFNLLEKICKNFDNIFFSLEDTISFIKKNPQLLDINKSIKRKGLS
jgi:spore coat polysaccharide biosynthesis protein SpsF